MGRKTAPYTKAGADQLADDKPAVYRIQTEGGKDNYVGVAKRGRVQERVAEHLGEIPGAKVRIEQAASISEAREKESRLISRNQPKYNEQGK